tara:strand:- start:77 stop:907 length:831 start_codon:yes stop_codon:yes gene_type:complete
MKYIDHKDSLHQLVTEGNIIIKDLIDHSLLSDANHLLEKELDISALKSKNLPGFKMGNLAIDSCYIHNKIWNELKNTRLIEALTEQFPEYRYVSFGGNLNLPGSKKQRYHIDSNEAHLTINVPLIKVTKSNGAVSVVNTNYLNPASTFTFFKGNLKKYSKRICSEKGDVILRFSTTWHRGNENRSQQTRMMLSFTLRKNWPWASQEKSVRHLIDKKSETNKVSFSGNIYPDSIFGLFLETLDYYVPKISMGLQHFRNMLESGRAMTEFLYFKQHTT